MGHIYLLIDKRNDKKYIGKHNGHKIDYWSSGIIPNRIIKKYGKEVFEREIIEDNIPNHLINEREVFYIEKYNTFNDGYNLSLGGDGGGEWIYKKTSEEILIIANIKSKKLKNRVFSDETKRKMSESAKNKIMTQEHKDNIRKAVILRGGHPHSEDTKKKLSILMTGRKNPNHSKFMEENNPKSQKISINGVIYNTIKDATLMLNLSRSSIKYRLNSKTDKFKYWFKLY